MLVLDYHSWLPLNHQVSLKMVPRFHLTENCFSSSGWGPERNFFVFSKFLQVITVGIRVWKSLRESIYLILKTYNPGNSDLVTSLRLYSKVIVEVWLYLLFMTRQSSTHNFTASCPFWKREGGLSQDIRHLQFSFTWRK